MDNAIDVEIGLAVSVRPVVGIAILRAVHPAASGHTRILKAETVCVNSAARAPVLLGLEVVLGHVRLVQSQRGGAMECLDPVDLLVKIVSGLDLCQEGFVGYPTWD